MCWTPGSTHLPSLESTNHHPHYHNHHHHYPSKIHWGRLTVSYLHNNFQGRLQQQNGESAVISVSSSSTPLLSNCVYMVWYNNEHRCVICDRGWLGKMDVKQLMCTFASSSVPFEDQQHSPAKTTEVWYRGRWSLMISPRDLQQIFRVYTMHTCAQCIIFTTGAGRH